jgi:hypothetical protein
MTPTRAGLVFPALVLILSGCGAVSAVTLRSTTAGVAFPDATRHLPRPAITPTPTPKPPVPPSSLPPVTSGHAGSIVVTLPATAGNEWLEILTTSGAVVARTEINPSDSWLTRAGLDGAYWTQGGVEHVLTTANTVRSLGSVPSDANGVVIAPDGVSYAYATSDVEASGAAVNKITVVHPGQAPEVIADRVSDPNHPTSDAPDGWDYYLISWTTPGITFARVPTGGCGCGSFDMQMQSQYSAVIDPNSETVTTLTSDAGCPLSNVGPAGLGDVCFATNTNGGTDAIRIVIGGVTRTYPMSGANVAGNAVFASTGSGVAYETIPISQDGCDETLTPTLHVMTVVTGTAISANIGDFTPAAWAPGGAIYGELETDSWANGWVVAVNPMTFAVTRLTADVPGVALVGIM